MEDVPCDDPDNDDSERIFVAKQPKGVFAKLIPFAVDKKRDVVVYQEHLLVVQFFISLVTPLILFLLL